MYWNYLFFHQGLGGVTSLVNAVTEFNDAFNDVIESSFSLTALKENVGTFGSFDPCALTYNIVRLNSEKPE